MTIREHNLKNGYGKKVVGFSRSTLAATLDVDRNLKERFLIIGKKKYVKEKTDLL